MRYKRIALALLVALAPILGVVAVQPATAQSQTYSKTFEGVGETKYVGFDTEGWGADTVRVIISTENGPGDTYVELHNQTWTTATLQSRNTHQLFANQGAYETITIEVRNAANEPTFVTGAETKDNMFTANWFASTGGDRDLVADFGEKTAMAVNPDLGIVDVTKDFRTVNESKFSSLDDNETKLEIYQAAASTGDTAKTVHAIMNNHLQDAETVALIKGKDAYIRSLNQAGSESVAESAADENISEFYSRQERNLIAEWNAVISDFQYYQALEDSESLPESFADVPVDKDSETWGSTMSHSVAGFGSTTYTLENGTTVDVKTVSVWINDSEFGNSHKWTVGPTTGQLEGVNAKGVSGKADTHAKSGDIERLYVAAPTSSQEDLTVLRFDKTANALSTIQTQSQSAQNQMNTVVNQTYDQYQAGQINSSDLVDPYVLQNRYSPGSEFEGWSAATLAALGTNQPTDFDNIGFMNITTNGQQYQGVLHAPSNPPSGEFKNDTTYYPSNFTGSFYISTDSRIVEVTGPFTIDHIQTSDGQVKANVTYVEKNYTTTSADDLEKLNQQLAELRAEIDARQQSLSGGGALFGSGSNAGVILLVVAGAVVALMMKDDDGNGGNSNGGDRRNRRRY